MTIFSKLTRSVPAARAASAVKFRFGVGVGLGVGVAAAIAGAGCSDGSFDEASRSVRSADTVGTNADAGAPTTPPTPTVDLAAYVGSYASFSRSVASANSSVIGTIRNVSSTFSVLEVTLTPGGLMTTEKACRIESGGTGPSVTIADAVPRGIPAFSSPLTLTQDGDTLRFERSEAVVIAGAQLANANLDLLPTDGSDKRLVDQDADGNPGVTASVKVNFLIKGDIYVVQRLRTSAKGTVTAGKVFQGVPKALTEQSIVGASNPILKVSVTLTPEFDAPENKALWVPVAAGTTCDQVLAQRKQLFNE